MDYRASKQQHEDFREGTIWADIKQFLAERLEQIRDELENPPPLPFYEGVKNTDINRGRAEEIRMLLDLPELIISDLQEIADKSKSKGE